MRQLDCYIVISTGKFRRRLSTYRKEIVRMLLYYVLASDGMGSRGTRINSAHKAIISIALIVLLILNTAAIHDITYTNGTYMQV